MGRDAAKRPRIEPHSMSKQFAKDYLTISIIPLLILFILVIVGTTITRSYLTQLIVASTSDLNEDAERNLQQLGEQLIQSKARDVAKQIEIYFRMHPDRTIEEMRNDPLFISLAIQKVGKTGYTAITETETYLFRVHPNEKLNDTDMRDLAEKLPSWWKIVSASSEGVEASGYYNWLEPDGSIRKKFMAFSPIRMTLQGTTEMVAATTYIDEFSAPIHDMRERADSIIAQYQRYVSRQWGIFSIIAIAVLILTFAGTYFLGRRAALRYIHPIMQLAQSARELGEGKWDIATHDEVLKRKDEIGTLAHALNSMSSQLRDLFNRLEQRVQELKETQNALEESEAHFRSLFDGVPVGLYRSAPDGTILDANPTLAGMLGFPDLVTFMKHNAAQLYLDPEERTLWQSQMEEKGTVHNFEIRMRRYDGSVAWIENQARAVRNETGHISYYEGSLKDVSERREAEEALKASEERLRLLYEESKKAEEVYRSLIHSSADAIVIYDLKGNASYISPMFSEMFEWSSDELLGKTVPFVPESEREITMKMVRQVIENGTPCQGFESKRTTKSGRVIDVSISASRYDDHKGRPAGMLVILRDISERKRLESQLQHIERMEAIGTLAGGIAHDFNNLLMVVQGSTSLLKQQLPDLDANQKILDNIEKQVQRGSRLTSQLLGYARKGRYQVRPLDLNAIVRENTETIRQTRKDITIHYDLSKKIKTIEADVYQIEQVLMNLFINASDAMPDGGELHLKTRNVSSDEMTNGPYKPKPGSYILLRVEDNGIGMNQKTLDRAFDPFFTTKEMGKGTGLGLSSVYGIVKSHGGYIDAESEIGRGTAFSIYLPASDSPIAPSGPKPRQVPKGEGTILLIDDEPLVLDVGAKMLRSLGYEVISASSGKQAIDIYKEQSEKIDLILLDMVMPDMGGSVSFDLLNKINPQAKVILSSGYSIDGKATEIMSRGCKGFIQKPYTIEQLSQKVQSVLSGATQE